MSKKLLTELRSFAETTSVRGIPRVMKAKTRVTFAVWLVAVLTCAALLVWQLSVVLTRYFQYPITTLTVQAPAWQTPTFPDITICNNDLDTMTYNQVNDIKAWINDRFSLTMNDGEKSGGTINGSFLPIFSAYYFDGFGMTSNAFTVEVSATWNPTYFMCFTLKPQNSSVRGSIRSLSAILYVDQASDKYSETIVTYPGSSAASAMNLLVHAPGTAPDMTLGMKIGPGTETIIQLTQSVRKRLGQPYSNCTDLPYLPWDNTSAVYTQPYCVMACVQQEIVEHCGCVTNSLTQCTMAQLRNANYQICAGMANNSYEQCMFGVTFDSDRDSWCSATCNLPCSELQYDAAISLAHWPRPVLLNDYSYAYLTDPRFQDLFNISANASHEEMLNATTTKTATDFFKSRFLQLNVEFGSQTITELKDVAAFTVDAMLAQIGGVLSLWLGVTVMFAFEAFEFLYIYLTNCRKEEPRQARRISVAPAVEAKPTVSPTQTSPASTAPSAEFDVFQTVVEQIE